MIAVLISFMTAFAIAGMGIWEHKEPKDRPKEWMDMRQPTVWPMPLTQSVRVEPQSALKYKNISRQAYDYSCGSAALVTLLNYDLGIEVTEQDAMEGMLANGEKEKIVERRGFSLLDMKRYVTTLGFKSEGFRGEISDLQELTTPAIVPIDYAGFKHFVVFRGIRNGYVYLADPSAGNIVFSLQEFADWWDRNTLFIIYRDEKKVAPNKLALTDKEMGLVDMDLIQDKALPSLMNEALRATKSLNGYGGVAILKR